MANVAARTVAIIAAGGMGAPIGARLAHAGFTVLTPLTGRSKSTVRRAEEAGIVDADLPEIARRADWVLSILPPSEARALAARFREVWDEAGRSQEGGRRLVYVDCNAVSPKTAKEIASVFSDAPGIVFLDGGIIGLPPSAPGAEGKRYDPTIYVSAEPEDDSVLDEFVRLSEGNIKVVPLKGEGVGIGDASALKMSYAGLSKGLMGLFTTMILSAHASSPATALALLNELGVSQPQLLARIAGSLPPMLPKAYRFSGEMEEIADFVGGEEAQVYQGLASLYERVAKSMKEDGSDVRVLREFVVGAKETLAKKEGNAGDIL